MVTRAGTTWSATVCGARQEAPPCGQAPAALPVQLQVGLAPDVLASALEERLLVEAAELDGLLHAHVQDGPGRVLAALSAVQEAHLERAGQTWGSRVTYVTLTLDFTPICWYPAFSVRGSCAPRPEATLSLRA